MKSALVTISFAAVLLLASAQAQDITITWQVSNDNISKGYLPKLASDGLQNVVTIDQMNQGKRTADGSFNDISAFQTQIGTIDTASVSWAGVSEFLYSPPQTTPQIGLAPSIALYLETSYPNCDSAIEVHQGAQEAEGSLWYQLGSNCSPEFSDIVWGKAIHYGTGYNATVAADLNESHPRKTTVVEVHQAEQGASALWYKVGVLTGQGMLGAAPTISWGPTTEITGNGGVTQGLKPTVTVANNLALLVAESAAGDGTLWYSFGMVDTTTSTIAWSDPVTYGDGFNPTVSLYGDGISAGGLGKGRVALEAHQVDSSPGSLVYSAGFLSGKTPTSITWSTDVNIPYANGCYPSVALFFDGSTGTTSSVGVAETHETACGTAKINYSFGYLTSTP